MIRKALELALKGFVLGMAVGNIIAIITTYCTGEVRIVSDLLLAKTGSTAAALLVQTFFSGVLGAVGMGGVVLYELENWNMIKIITVHYLMIMLSYFLIGPQLGWGDFTLPYMLVMALIYALIYLLIWVIMFLRYRAEVRELNALIGEETNENIILK